MPVSVNLNICLNEEYLCIVVNLNNVLGIFSILIVMDHIRLVGTLMRGLGFRQVGYVSIAPIPTLGRSCMVHQHDLED